EEPPALDLEPRGYDAPRGFAVGDLATRGGTDGAVRAAGQLHHDDLRDQRMRLGCERGPNSRLATNPQATRPLRTRRVPRAEAEQLLAQRGECRALVARLLPAARVAGERVALGRDAVAPRRDPPLPQRLVLLLRRHHRDVLRQPHLV